MIPKSKREFEQMLTQEQMEVVRRHRAAVKRTNRHAVALIMLGKQALTTKEFAEKSGMARATAFSILKEMADARLVERRYDKKNLLSYWMRKQE